jgi:two-component system chemotaxis response regulator CheY
MRRIIGGALKKLNVNDIVEASNGQEAVDTVMKNNNIGLILMDWNMPTMSGIDAVKKLREFNVKTPIVMVSTEGEKQKVIEAIKAGANDYLVKPFDPKSAEAKLEKFLQPSESQ